MDVTHPAISEQDVDLADFAEAAVPELLNAGSFLIAVQLLTWRLRTTLGSYAVLALRLLAGTSPSLLAQAGPPIPTERLEAIVAAAVSGATGKSGHVAFPWVDDKPDDAPTDSVFEIIELDDNHSLLLVVTPGIDDDAVRAQLTRMASLSGSALAAALRTERLSADLVEARRLVHDTKAERRAKNAFLARMSHDLRTPLTSVLGFGQLLELEPLNENQAEYVQHIVQGGRRLLELITRTLELTSIDSGKLTMSLEPVRVTGAIQKCIAEAMPLAQERGVEIRAQPMQSDDLWVLGDSERVKQILQNLLSNGITYNSRNGLVEVSAEVTSDNFVQIKVRDTGPGVPRTQIPRLFEPFDRLNAPSEIPGTGLGLAISRALATALGGNLRVDSAIGRGSTFTLELPATTAPGSGNN